MACGVPDEPSRKDDSGEEADPFLLPEAPGPFLVGNRSVFIENPEGRLDCAKGPRTLLTELWYPASDAAISLPEDTTRDFFLGRWEEVVAAMGGDGDAMLDLPTGSRRDAPLAERSPSMPVLVFSHGFGSTRFQNYTLAAWLASHGYLVVAPDHPCDAIVTLDEEDVIVGGDVDPLLALQDRVADLGVLLDTLEAAPPDWIAGRLDTGRFGLIGHSYGGVSILELVKTETRPTALLALAAFAFPPMPTDLALASMHGWALEDKIMGSFEPWHDEAWAALPSPRYRLVFPDTGHFAFTDLCLFIPDMATENGCGTETRVDAEELFTNPAHGRMQEALGAMATAFFGASFFAAPDLVEWLEENPYPELFSFFAEP
jgi:pimeloyl-ACP methyl ester carboxylesterase